jgi:hypothetical protein
VTKNFGLAIALEVAVAMAIGEDCIPCGLCFDHHITETPADITGTSRAAGVTACLDETVPGRMYSGPIVLALA